MVLFARLDRPTAPRGEISSPYEQHTANASYLPMINLDLAVIRDERSEAEEVREAVETVRCTGVPRKSGLSEDSPEA